MSDADPSKRSLIDEASRPQESALRALSNPRATAKDQLKAAKVLVRYGRLQEAVAVLERLAAVPETAKAATNLLKTSRDLLPFAVSEAAPAQRSEETGYWVKGAGSEVTLIAFAGKAQRVGVSIYFLERLLGRFGFNLIFLFDWLDVAYLGGVSGLGGDAREASAALRDISAGLGGKKIICLGQSAGGHAALRYALELDATGTLAFSPTILDVASETSLSRMSGALGRDIPAEELDLRALYAARARPISTKIIYGADNAADGRAAARLAGIRGVEIESLPGVAMHGTLEYCVTRGVFFETVNPVLTRFAKDPPRGLIGAVSGALSLLSRRPR